MARPQARRPLWRDRIPQVPVHRVGGAGHLAPLQEGPGKWHVQRAARNQEAQRDGEVDGDVLRLPEAQRRGPDQPAQSRVGSRRQVRVQAPLLAARVEQLVAQQRFRAVAVHPEPLGGLSVARVHRQVRIADGLLQDGLQGVDLAPVERGLALYAAGVAGRRDAIDERAWCGTRFRQSDAGSAVVLFAERLRHKSQPPAAAQGSQGLGAQGLGAQVVQAVGRTRLAGQPVLGVARQALDLE